MGETLKDFLGRMEEEAKVTGRILFFTIKVDGFRETNNFTVIDCATGMRVSDFILDVE